MPRASIQPNGKKLLDHRRAKGFSQDDLAAEAGVNKKTVQKAENGESITASTLKLIAKALDTNPTVFFPVDGEPDPGSNEESIIEIHLDERFYASIDEAKQNTLKTVIAIAKQEARIVRVRISTITLVLKMSPQAALAVLNEATSGTLDLPGLLDVRVVSPPPTGKYLPEPSPPSMSWAEEELAAAFSSGPNEKGWHTIAGAVRAVVSARYRKLQQADRDDLVQTTLMRLHSKPPIFRDPPEGRPYGFLSRVVFNVACDSFRASSAASRSPRRPSELLTAEEAEKALGEVPAPPERPTLVERHAVLDVIQRAFERATQRGPWSRPPWTWDLFARMCLEGPSSNEIASELGVTTMTLRTMFSRVKKKIRHELAQMGYADEAAFFP